MKIPHQRTALLGLSAVALFITTLIAFALKNPEFNPIWDNISKLGAVGQKNAFGWNLLGFGAVGLLFAAFGWGYGTILQDKLTACLLAAFGIGFAATGLPIDFANETAPLSKAHIVAICLGVASWLFALARIGMLNNPEPAIRTTANTTATLFILPVIGELAALWPSPITHRLVFLAIFGWVIFSSIGLLRKAHG